MMACAGTAYASMVVSSFGRAHQRVIKMGFADDLDTRIMITGWSIGFILRHRMKVSHHNYLFN